VTYPYPSDADRLLSNIRNGAWLEVQTFLPLAYAVPEVIPEAQCCWSGPPRSARAGWCCRSP
jgi:hypothetical protein